MKLKACGALLGLLFTATLHAQQFEIDARVENAATQGTINIPASPPVTGAQFGGFASSSASSNAVSTSSALGERYPSDITGNIILKQSVVGGTFASGVPRYSLGEQILPPLVQIDGETPAPSGYWRVKPVLPGEFIAGIGEAIPDGSVTVLNSSTNSSTVTVESITADVKIGATLLGQPITNIVGNNITLGGNARSSISSSTVVAVIPATSYYYSPHAEKVFASQAGRVTITWVTNQPVSDNDYAIKTETFAVSANAVQTPKIIYWTEGSFDGPRVPVRDTSVVTVNPVYNSRVPKAVPEEVSLPGYNPQVPNLKTLYFDKLSGNGELKAYNVEGRILIEYLGDVRLGQDIHEHLGIDIIDIKRVPEIRFAQIHLGNEIVPSDGTTGLIASPVRASSQEATSYYASHVKPDGGLAYYAEATTSPENRPDNGEPISNDAYNKVVFYWLEGGRFGTEWPRFQEKYWLRWSPYLDDYEFYTVDTSGSTPQTGVSFDGGGLPEIVFQDDPNETEASIDLTSQRLVVHFRPGNDRNRSLLKFSSGSEFWYVNLYTQAENRGYELASTVDSYQTIVTVPFTTYLQVGDVVATSGYKEIGQITEILDSTRFVLTTSLASGTKDYQFPSGSHNLYFFRQFSASSYYGGFSASQTTINNTGSPLIVNVGDTSSLEVGMVLTDPSAGVSTRIVRIIDGSTIEVSSPLTAGDYTFNFTTEPDLQAPIVASAYVGSRINPPAGHELGGYISKGDLYLPSAYIDPFSQGVDAASAGAIIPVNAIPERDKLTVRWFKKVNSPSQQFRSFYVPGKIGRYTLEYPSSAPTITIAQGIGSGDLLPDRLSGEIYYQNNSAETGYNPNEEHALLIAGRAYALRDDLNITSGESYTSQPYILLSYTDGEDSRPNMEIYKIQRESNTYKFDYPAVAGTLLNKPYPLPLLSLPLELDDNNNLVNKDTEIDIETPDNSNLADIPEYKHFTFEDRKGYTWVHRGPHTSESSPVLTMRLYYPIQEGFYIPGQSPQPETGTIVPFLRDASLTGTTLDLNNIDIDQSNEPLLITYRPQWPSNTPKLRIGETLTLPKFGLPQVRGQKSAHVLYQQSLANGDTDRTNLLEDSSVILHDPTRQKSYTLSTSGLEKLPASLKTTSYRGKYYFQRVPAHLQERFFFDPLRGQKGELVLQGVFHDVPAGEDYLDLNVLTSLEINTLKALVPVSDTDKSKWDTAIDNLTTVVETFRENPSQRGTYEPKASLNSKLLKAGDAAYISDADSAVDSYALTATGQGSGYVTMVFGNGRAFTPEGDPVVVKVFEVEPRLYTGDLKVIQSQNPLDEQVTLRHSADFAAKAADYDFEWRWTTASASAPPTYQNTMTERLGSGQWKIVQAPGDILPTAAQYDAVTAQPLSAGVNVHPSSYTQAQEDLGYPGIVLKAEDALDFSAGVPTKVVFSAELGTFDGFVLYVNGVQTIAHNAPEAFFESTGAASGLTEGGLTKQFTIPLSFFSKGNNKIEIAIYTEADVNSTSPLQFRFHGANRQEVANFDSIWLSPSDPTGINTNFALVGGDTSLPFGASHFVLNDRWFTMRYRPKTGTSHILAPESGTSEDGWSDWTSPMFVEGWVKRVLAAINPFEQRMKNLYENAINSDVSVITQAGTRWEGDIALTLDTVNNVGLIEIYETVLNRARSMSIDANVNDPDTNTALLLAAGYLNDLYNILGNEAYADAANPTISIDDQSGATEVNTSRFSFESQVANSLEEELALLRGRDDLVSPGVRTAPAYNRLYWNYTRGINSGEVLYAVNYNIREKAGSDTADGVIDEADAQRMFPQGHGDAYGHYLTALKGYYRLLGNDNFDWVPRAEAVTVLGQPVTIDYSDERKFAASAANLARTAEQVLNLTYRKNYKDDPSRGWAHLKDNRSNNSNTGITPSQGFDEWTSRATQGAYYHWAMANTLVPAEDNINTGIQKIDRTTVPELGQLVTSVDSFQTTADNANARLNPLGLSPGAIAFDISPADLQNGESHFEQIYSRAKTALNNAAGAFNRAAVMTRSLRAQESQLDDFDAQLAQQELAYTNRLIEIFGQPYNGDVGPGKLYAQGYNGPDLVHWFIVDQPNDLAEPTDVFTIEVEEPKEFLEDIADPVQNILNRLQPINYEKTTVNIQPGQFAQYNQVWKPGGLGARPETGQLQQALYEAHRNYLVLKEISESYQDEKALLAISASSFRELLKSRQAQIDASSEAYETIASLDRAVANLELTGSVLDVVAEAAVHMSDALGEAPPKTVGVANDATSVARAGIKVVGAATYIVSKLASSVATGTARNLETNMLEEELDLEKRLAELEFSLESRQAAYELQKQYTEYAGITRDLYTYTLDYQRSLEKVRSILSQGNRVLEEREIFRQRAAAIIQGYRTNDLSFRLFRDESLEQYRSLYDLAARYCYLAAKSYDYETGLLGTDDGQDVFTSLVSSRALGDITNGEPQATTSELGDSGLAGTMARLAADFSVAEGRLGINNPDQYGTVFSLRKELFRILDDPNKTIDDEAWQQTLEMHMVDDLMADEDIANYCRSLAREDGGPVPGIVINFGSTIEQGKNFFGLPLAGGDHNFSTSSYATKIYSVGIALPGYVGMDPYASGTVQAGESAGTSGDALSATPYVYFVPTGTDYMLAPPLGGGTTRRSWKVADQALPLPFNLGNSDFNSGQYFSANGTLTESPYILRQHQAFRAVADPSFFYSRVPAEFTNSRLIGRSVWNGQWKLVIPAYTLLQDEQEGLDRFSRSVKDIQLFLRTYSNSGN